MRVVLIAYHYAPDHTVGSLRAANVAHAFVGAGHRVDVVTVRLPADDERRRPRDHRGLMVHSVAPMPSPRDVIASLKSQIAALWATRRTGPGVRRTTWTPPTRVATWQRLLSSLLWLPDDRQGFIVPAWRKARALVREGADVVYSTAPPYSPHLAALLVKRSTGVRWVMELRDPWADNDQKPWWVRTRATDALDRQLERLCVTRADLIVSVSDGIRSRLLARWPMLDSSRVLVVRNGIERLGACRAGRSPGPLRIVYAGTFYYGRDPRPFLRGLATVCRRRGMGPQQVQVQFVGACRWLGAVAVEKEIEALGLTGIVRIQDWMSHTEVQTIVEDADVLLLLAQEQPAQVPNKLYEYLGSRRRVLAFADEDGETAQMLRQVGGHQVVTSDNRAEVERALEAVLVSEAPNTRPAANEMLLKEWTTDVQMRRLLAAVSAHG
jgi:hypothetical protein